MWKNRVQNTSSGSKTNGQKKATNLQHLSPFASHSTVDSAASPSTISPKSGTELPSGVRYIRQTPSSIYRPITGRPIASTVAKGRERSPEKNLRFADPLQCTRKHDMTDAPKPTVRTRSTSRDRNLVRPVINAEPTATEVQCKRYSSHNHNKVVATSPATRQTSPIFSTVDFGGDTNRNSLSKKSPTIEQMPKSRSHSVNDMKTVPNSNSNPKLISSQDRQPLIKTEIMTPNGTVLKRSSAVTSKVGNNGAVHRNTVSFPLQTSSNRTVDQSRLSVNVNVAVGLDCNDNRMNHFIPMEEEYNYNNEGMNEGMDEVDWMPSTDKGFGIQVAVRLRPFIQSEIDSKNNISVIEMNGSTVRVINSDNDNYNRMEYGFDVCLNSSDRDLFNFADQDTVFKRMGEPLLERALEGYNVCLFAYGQTGSGKSFTMTGTETNPGVIPRFVHELYRRISSLTEVLFAVEVSYYEIYNEKIYDLLSDDKDHNKKLLRIREHPQTGPYVEHLSQHTVEEYDEVMDLLRSGNRRRVTASTAANSDSSRSHSIFTIVLSQLKNNSDEMGLDMSCACGSRINLIDLAGSERVGHCGTSGDRLKEGSLINKSLLNLGKVISKLADYSANPTKSAHIPYRDSALTWLLKESLGGNSQTSMIATISPAKCHLEETLSTIRYAAIARRIVNYVHINEDPKTKKIRELMEIISELRAKQTMDAIESRDKELPKGIQSSPSDQHSSDNSKNTSDDSKNSSFDSQSSDHKKVQRKSMATNTSFVTDRRTSTKGTDTSFSQPVVVQNKKKTATIATNTSFIKPSKTCSTSTETQPIESPPKPKTVSTATEMSFIEPEHVDISTNTSFVELPSRFDLLRFKKLEEQEKQLLEDIRKHKEKLIKELDRKVEDWSPIGSEKFQNDDIVSGSDTLSVDNYYDAEDVIECESIQSGNTYVISEDTVDQTYKKTDVKASRDVTKQSSDKHSIKKKDKKKKKKDIDEWGTPHINNTVDNTNEWTQESNWNNPLEKIKEVDELKYYSDHNKDAYSDWDQKESNISDKHNNECNDWSVDPKDNQTEDNVTKTSDRNDEFGTDTNSKSSEQNTDWQTEGDNQWGTDDHNRTQTEDNQNEWSVNETIEQTQSQNAANDWGTDDNKWSEEPKKSEQKNSNKKSNKKDKKNKKKDKSEDEWGTEPNTTDKKSNELTQEDNWSTDNQSSAQNKENADNEWGDDWAATDATNKCDDIPEECGDWDEDNNKDTNDNNETQDNQFDWGTDTTDNTVIDVKKESPEDVDEDNW